MAYLPHSEGWDNSSLAMIYVATVHWKDARWIDVQLKYLSRMLTEPFRIFAWLNEVPGDHRQKFYYVNEEEVDQHPIKLNILADLISFDSRQRDDWLIFMDGDAFPIGDIVGFAREKLRQYPLLAVQRLENNGDLQPHPCFCATTVGFWTDVKGDWKQGYPWIDPNGNEMTDVGGNLLGILRQKQVEWYPMRRSNRVNLHPLWFGIYDSLVYHHGAAFRYPVSRIDLEGALAQAKTSWGWPLAVAITQLDRQKRFRFLRRFNPIHRRVARRNQELSLEVFNRLQNDPDFYQEFL